MNWSLKIKEPTFSKIDSKEMVDEGTLKDVFFCSVLSGASFISFHCPKNYSCLPLPYHHSSEMATSCSQHQKFPDEPAWKGKKKHSLPMDDI